MDNSKKEYVYKLLYSENKKDTIDAIKTITDSKLLHIIAANYNWDDGFEIPYNIINNDNCDLGTALKVFYDADGYRVLENREELNNSNSKEWTSFILQLEDRILNNKFNVNHIKFIPPLTKVQIFKLKKSNPNINKVFIEENNGEMVEIDNI